MTFENETIAKRPKTIPITELEPLVEKIEVMSSILLHILQECPKPLPLETCVRLKSNLDNEPDLRDWLDNLR